MKEETDIDLSEPVVQALGTLEWVLVHIVFNVRARTAVQFRHDLRKAGIEIPKSVIESPTWFGAFHCAPDVAKHARGFGGLLRDRLIELGFEEDAVEGAIVGIEDDLLGLCLDVQTAVAMRLRADLQSIRLDVPVSMLQSREWRDVFTREQVKLPAGAAAIVEHGTDSSVFRAVEEGTAPDWSGFLA